MGSSVHSKIDLNSSFYQLLLGEVAQRYCIFHFDGCCYQFLRLPQGIVDSSSHFQRFMDMTFETEQNEGWLSAFIDDLSLHSEDAAEAVSHLMRVFQRLLEAGLTVNWKKLELFRTKLNLLGMIVSKNELAIDPDRTDAIMKLGPPETRTQLLQLLGVLQYNARFVRDFALKLAPLQDLNRTGVSPAAYWNDGHTAVLERLKHEVCNSLPLHLPDFSTLRAHPFEIEVDSSNTGVGAVLGQRDASGHFRPIAYASHRYAADQLKWHTNVQECFAIWWAVQRWERYLCTHPFILHTDHLNLTFGAEACSNKMVARWLLDLQGRRMHVRHRRGVDNACADGLSRLPWTLSYSADDRAAVTATGYPWVLSYDESNLLDARSVTPTAATVDTVFNVTVTDDATVLSASAVQAAATSAFVAAVRTRHSASRARGSAQSPIESFVRAKPIAEHTARRVTRGTSRLPPIVEAPVALPSRQRALACDDIAALIADADAAADATIGARIAARRETSRARAVASADLESLFAETADSESDADEVAVSVSLSASTAAAKPFVPALEAAIPASEEEAIPLSSAAESQWPFGDSVPTFLSEVRQAQLDAPAEERARWQSFAKFYELDVDGALLWHREGKIVIPVSARALQERLMCAAHDNATHGSPKQMLRSFQRNPFSWEGISRSVLKWCNSCYLCATRKQRDCPARHGLLQRVVGTSPNHIWGADFVGELLPSKAGSKFLLVFTDYFSRLTYLAAVPAQTGQAVVDLFKKLVVKTHGPPLGFIFDSGKPFDNALVKAYCKSNGIQWHKTSAYHHQSLGIPERRNADIMAQTRLRTRSRWSDWDICLEDVAWALNSAYHESLGMSPYQAFHGRPPRTALDIATDTAVDAPTTIAEVTDWFDAVQQFVLLRQDTEFVLRKQRHDAVHRAIDLAVGSFVMVHYPQRANKFDFVWRGPREVLAKHSALAYSVRSRLTNAVERLHVARLRPFDPSRTTLRDELEDVLRDGNFIVDRISAHSWRAGKLYLRVHWAEGSGAPHSVSWEDWYNLRRTEASRAYCVEHTLSPRGKGRKTKDNRSKVSSSLASEP